MSKFAIDDKYTKALECEAFEARRQAKFNAELDNYYVYGWFEPNLATVTAMTRPTLTSELNPTTPNQDNS